MKGVHSLAGVLLVLGFIQSSWQVPLLEADNSSSLEVESAALDEPRELSNMKRHSEGTFSNDYSKYLEDRRAQEFVRWLMNNKRSGAAAKRHADGTYTSDVSSYLQEQAVKDFVARLKSGHVRRESEVDGKGEALSRRHVDGSFTSDVNKVLDSMAAKEYLLWVMTSKASGERLRPSASAHNPTSQMVMTISRIQLPREVKSARGGKRSRATAPPPTLHRFT
ncbi:glucagon-1-like [Diretmus argenteus]